MAIIIRMSLLLAIYLSHYVDGANILLLEEMPSPSHHLWFKSVTAALAAKGYNITVAICSGFLKSAGWEQLMKYPDDFKFDLIIHDYIVGGCLLSFMQRFSNVPLVSMTAFGDNLVQPFATHASLVPALNPYPALKASPSTFKERVTNVMLHLVDKVAYMYYHCPTLTTLVQGVTDFDSTVSTVCGLTRKSILYLTNYDPVVDGPQQLPPNVIGVGGLQIKKPQPLSEDFQNIVDNAPDGLILFSLGTNVQSNSLGDEVISGVLQAFGQLPSHRFLWKIDLETFPVPVPENVFVRDWIPQNDILANNNTKLFITHAGLLSTQEAIWHGVPMLGIPIFSDQFVNIHRSVDKGIAQVLYLNELTKENLYAKIRSMLTNPMYRENVQIASKAFQDQKETPLERAVWWIEWAMRNPNVSHFKGDGQRLNFLQIESIDVYAFLTIVCTAIVWMLLWISYKIIRYVFFSKNTIPAKSTKANKKEKKLN